MRTRFLLALAGAMLLQMPLSAQVKIGNNPQTIHPSSLLELESSDRVLVISRVSTAQMEAIVPERGALVYNTDEQCLFYYDGLQWQNVCASLPYQFTTDPIVNTAETIVITENGEVFNFEVGEIRSENIADFSISGVDIQNNAIGADKLAPDAVGTEELQDNSIADAEINFAEVTLSDFTNDAGYLTTADLVSADDDNVLFNGSDGGVYYNDQFLIDAIDLNTTLLNAKENLSNKSDDALLGDTNPSTTLYPTQNAVKTYVDNAVGGAAITGDPNGVFFANAATGAPTTNAPSLQWDQSKRFGTGALGIGIDGGTLGDFSKLHISEQRFGTIAYPIEIQNRVGIDNSGTSVGVLFAVEASGTFGKGGLIYERRDTWGRGAFHFLQNTTTNTSIPTLADAVFTVTNAGQVGIGTTTPAGANLLQVAGRTQTQSLSVTGALLDSGGNAGAAGQLLSSTGGGTQWIAAPSGADGVISGVSTSGTNLDFTGVGGAFDGLVNLEGLVDLAASNNGYLTSPAVINSTATITVTGSGTAGDPYELSGDDQTADVVGINYVPVNYSRPDINGNTAFDVEDHLAGIDAALAGGGGADGSETIINSTGSVIVAGTGTLADPYLLTSTGGADGSETIINNSASVTVAGTGTAADPYILTSAGGDGSETIVNGSATVSVTGTGTAADPYVLTSADTSDGSETIINNSASVTVAGTGTAADPYILTSAGGDGSETIVNGSATVSVTGTGTAADPYVLTSVDTSDGSETVINNSASVTVAGTGTAADPYILTSAGGDGSETVIDAGSSESIVSGSGTVADPYIVNPSNSSTAGAVFFSNGTGGIAESPANLFWDTTNDRLGIGTNTPDRALEVNGEVKSTSFASGGGSAALPGYGFHTNDDFNTGMYRIAADHLGFSTGGNLVLQIDAFENVGIGIAPTQKLHVDGNILATGTITPDYVFQKYFNGQSELKPSYEILSLKEVYDFVQKNKHLPGVPSAAEVKNQGGVLVNRATEINLEKIEELFLHTIEQQEQIEALEQEKANLSKEVADLKARLERIESLLRGKDE